MAHEVFVILPETRDGLSARGRTAGGKGCDGGSCAPARGRPAGGKDVTGVHARPHAARRQERRRWRREFMRAHMWADAGQGENGPALRAFAGAGYSNFRSYSTAAMSTTRQEPALCTRAPVVGVRTSSRDSAMARKLMAMDRAMLHRMVFTVALDSRLR